MPASENGYRNTLQRKFLQRKIQEFVIDETLIKVGFQHIWILKSIEPMDWQILLYVDISFELNMLISERFFTSLINNFDKHPPIVSI